MLEESLACNVDVVTYKSLNPLLKDRILKEQDVLI
jgi:predicted nucleotidyltransferase